VPLIANKQKKKKTDKTDTVLTDAVDRLLRATKKKMLREKGRIDYERLARDGFSSTMIERLKML
jgi:hypothetical protein